MVVNSLFEFSLRNASILGHEKFMKVICIVCSLYLVKNELCPIMYCYCFVEYFYVNWPQLTMFPYVNMN